MRIVRWLLVLAALSLALASGGGRTRGVPAGRPPAPMLMSGGVGLVQAFYGRPSGGGEEGGGWVLPGTSVSPLPQVPASQAAALAAARQPGVTTLATLATDVPRSPGPGMPPDATVPGSWYGYPSTLPVIDQQPGWVEVRLAQRPNQSTAWLPADQVALSQTPYRLVVTVSTQHLQLFRYGQAVLSFPAGVGTPDDPTVTGHYFVTMQVPPPDPGYGPFVLVTSAHSDAIADWAGSGDAIIAIHGPIDSHDDALIGTTGARISHGCVRLHDADLAQLADVPAGTPLDIEP